MLKIYGGIMQLLVMQKIVCLAILILICCAEKMESEIVDITLNITGADYFITVDLHTAQELLNGKVLILFFSIFFITCETDDISDQSLPERYVNEAFPECFSKNQLEVITDEIADDADFEMHSLENLSESLQKDKQQKVWFFKGNPSAADDEATIYFLKLREKYASQFNDKKTVKNKL